MALKQVTTNLSVWVSRGCKQAGNDAHTRAVCVAGWPKQGLLALTHPTCGPGAPATAAVPLPASSSLRRVLRIWFSTAFMDGFRSCLALVVAHVGGAGWACFCWVRYLDVPKPSWLRRVKSIRQLYSPKNEEGRAEGPALRYLAFIRPNTAPCLQKTEHKKAAGEDALGLAAMPKARFPDDGGDGPPPRRQLQNKGLSMGNNSGPNRSLQQQQQRGAGKPVHAGQQQHRAMQSGRPHGRHAAADGYALNSRRGGEEEDGDDMGPSTSGRKRKADDEDEEDERYKCVCFCAVHVHAEGRRGRGYHSPP